MVDCGRMCAQARVLARQGINLYEVCPMCGAGFRGDGFVYAMQAEGPCGPVKIGFSRDPWERLRQIQTGCPYELCLLGAEPNCAPEDERKRHSQIWRRLRGEWFAFEDAEHVVRQIVRNGSRAGLSFQEWA